MFGYVSAWSRSSIRLFTSSGPMLSLTRSSDILSLSLSSFGMWLWLDSAGQEIDDSVLPGLGDGVMILSFLNSF